MVPPLREFLIPVDPPGRDASPPVLGALGPRSLDRLGVTVGGFASNVALIVGGNL